jgi:hypothetical protein
LLSGHKGKFLFAQICFQCSSVVYIIHQNVLFIIIVVIFNIMYVCISHMSEISLSAIYIQQASALMIHLVVYVTLLHVRLLAAHELSSYN